MREFESQDILVERKGERRRGRICWVEKIIGAKHDQKSLRGQSEIRDEISSRDQ